MKRLVLIDSHAIIHRAYHALPPLTTSAGEPVNAVYGFASMLLRILADLKPDYLAAAFDLPGPTFRHAAYERYKAQRPETPSDLSGQFGKVKDLLRAFGVPIFFKEGYEADDIIGTIAKKMERKKIEVIIVTGDMDALQLVRPNIKVYAMKKGITETVTYTEEAVEARYGLKPDQLVDFKGLKGDPSDNISGVKGIGEKTAADLLQKYNSIEKIYKNFSKIRKNLSGSVAVKLEAGKEDAFLSRDLARIKIDVPIDFSLEDVIYRDSKDKTAVTKIFQEYGFGSLLKRMGVVSVLSAKKSSVQGSQGSLAGFGDKPDVDKKLALNPKPGSFMLSEFLEKKVEAPLTSILQEMHKIGIKLDTGFLKDMSSRLDKKLAKIKEDIYKLAGEEFNINSTRELSKILFEKLQLPIVGLRRTAKGGVISTDASELTKLEKHHEIVPVILEYRELNKLKNTYVDVLPKLVGSDGRLHTTFDQFGASTGRLSSANPNLQNIPIMSEMGREIRKAFVADKGYVLASFDYSQIELRVVAHLADDPKMIEAFRRGADIHKMTAAEINNISLDRVTPELRRAAKTLNFGIIYGMGSQAFAESTGLPRKDAKKFIDEYFHDFSGIREYMEKTKKFAREHGYVETMFGRRRHIPEIFSANWRIKREAERMAINMPIQGTATGDIVKMAMVRVHDWIKKNNLSDRVRLLLQVHDELVFEIEDKLTKKAVPIIKNLMETVTKLKVPIMVDYQIGKNWEK